MTVDRRTWAYKNGEGRIFASPEDVPPGWSDSPASQTSEPEPAEENDLRTEAEALGIKVDGRWSDKRLKEEIEKASGNNT